ncbi:MAG: phosphoenolpyruvate--protein phosphotransferase [Planctomycetota bacterium JB042]
MDGPDAGELVLKGIPVSHGIGIGPVFAETESFPADGDAHLVAPEDVPAELKRLEVAMRLAREELANVREEAARKVGEHDARIFLVHLQVLEDRSLQEQIEASIRDEGVSAEAGVAHVIGRYADAFSKLEDPLARERATDVKDVGRRLLRHLSSSVEETTASPRTRYILVTKELFPSDAARLDRDRLAGIVTEVGGKASHAAILARALGIPAVTGVRQSARLLEAGGKTTIVDGRDGTVVVDPTKETLERYLRGAEAVERVRTAFAAEPALPAVTRDGVAIDVLVNVENAGDVMPEDLGDIAGIGLYRTEFVYMDRDSFPSEDEQFEVYRRVVERAGHREVVFRTIDIGGDKRLPYFRVKDEDNPALGWRGYRISDEWPDMFIAQVRALLRASAFGHVKIMLPMITTVEEVRRAVAFVDDVRSDLARRKVPYSEHVPLGVMVEVPAAVFAIESMLKEVDFVSIGSNDLIQYLLAVDRNNARVANLSQPLNPSVLRAVQTVIRAANAAGRPVSLCGEMAGSYYCTLVLLGLGLRRFSMARHYVAGVGRLIRAVTMKEAESVARRVLAFTTTAEVRAFLNARTREIFREMGIPIDEVSL